MNIYLDIDGVLLSGTNQAANFANGFLQLVLTNWPDSVYWLTVHQWHGRDVTVQVLKPALNPETRKLMHLIKPTKWHHLKTDAIDFTVPFLWYDSMASPEERSVLEAYKCLESWRKIDLEKDPNQLVDEYTWLQKLI